MYQKPEQKIPEGNIIIYTAPDGSIRLDVVLEGETLWLTQKRMAELFGVEQHTISYHINEIIKSAELSEEQTHRIFRLVQKEGGREVVRQTSFYNLDMIISVGYRVNSRQATQFRIWATKTLREFIIKGFVLDDERLKNGRHFSKEYFDELLERIREIRSSERRFYQKLLDLYAQCSSDYDSHAPATQLFYKTVQNKLHWAITGHTAAELIAARANLALPHMGLTTWKHAPRGKILKSDVAVAKNYLSQEELAELNRIVSMYLDYAENQAHKHRVMSMADWVHKLDAFLQFNEYDILDNPGAVSHEVAARLAEDAYSEFRVTQDQEYVSDFDEAVKKYVEQKEKG